MVRIVLTVTDDMNNWIIQSGGERKGDRQKFIVTTLNMIKNGLIIKSTGLSPIQPSDLKQNIDILRAEAEAKARKGDTQDSLGRTSIFFTPLDILEEIKSLPRFQTISQENRDTIRIMKEESKKVSSFLPTPAKLDYPTPPPSPPKKDDKNAD